MVITYYKTPEMAKVEERSGPIARSWINAVNPSLSELEALGNLYDLKLGHLQDALDPDEVPRLEREAEQIYIFIRAPYEDGDKMLTAPLLVVFTEEVIITITNRRLPYLESVIKKNKLQSTEPLEVFTEILAKVNGSYQVAMNMLNRRVNNIRDKFDQIRNRDILQLVTIEEVLSNYLSALVLTKRVLSVVTNGKELQIEEKYYEHVEDIYLSIGQLVEVCQLNINSVSNLREAYSTILTNNLNRVIKLFTSLTIILTIPTIISSFFGMNVGIPTGHPEAFFHILGATVLVSCGVLAIFIKNDWI